MPPPPPSAVPFFYYEIRAPPSNAIGCWLVFSFVDAAFWLIIIPVFYLCSTFWRSHISRPCVFYVLPIRTPGGHVQPPGDSERCKGSNVQGGQDTVLDLGGSPAQRQGGMASGAGVTPSNHHARRTAVNAVVWIIVEGAGDNHVPLQKGIIDRESCRPNAYRVFPYKSLYILSTFPYDRRNHLRYCCMHIEEDICIVRVEPRTPPTVAEERHVGTRLLSPGNHRLHFPLL